MTTPDAPYLLDTYIDYRNTQDQQISTEFRVVREEIGVLKVELHELRREVREDIDGLRREVRQNAAEQSRSTAWLRNQLLSNPTLPIQPIVIVDETRGVVQPDMNLFPRHAKEFYTLRDPQTERQRAKLAYMVSFYDVTLPERMGSSSSSESLSNAESSEDGNSGSDDGSDDDTFQDRNALAVYMLEGILGLSEDRFITFMERARERAARAAAPVKRQAQDQPPSEAPSATRPFSMDPGLALRPNPIPPLTVSQIIAGSAHNKSSGSGSQDSNHSNARLTWRIGPRPDLQQATEGAEGAGSSHGGGSQHRLSSRSKNAEIQEEQKDAPSEPGDSGSPTNPHSRTPSSTRYR